MNIKIICVGKLKEKYFKQGIAEYAKRMSKFAKFQIVEVPDEKAPESLSNAEMENVIITGSAEARGYSDFVWAFHVTSPINAVSAVGAGLSGVYD